MDVGRIKNYVNGSFEDRNMNSLERSRSKIW
jgi:hypothetical protein